jgi:D-inositol-3-phosphate glycosyltransferase
MGYSIAMFSVHTSPLDEPGRTKDAGGMNVYIRELASALAQRNVKVDIFTRWVDETSPQVVYLKPNVRVVHIQAGPFSILHKNELYQYMPLFARNVDEFRHKEGRYYDLIHSHYWLSGVAALPLARRWDVPHLIMFHTLALLKQLANPGEPEPPLRLEMEQKLIREVDRIIAATSDERNQLMRYCGATAEQVEVIPCGVDLRLFLPRETQQARIQLGLDIRKPLLLFVGRLDPFKGPDLLLYSVAQMKEEAHVAIVGGKLSGDKEVKVLQELARDLKIDQRVHFFGARPRHEMPLFYNAADVTVVPSYHESFGLAAVESLACGTPVVATRAGGLTTTVQDGKTGFLVPRCAGFFAGRLDTLIRDTDLRVRMSAAARDSVLQFGWKSVACQMRSLYDYLIDEAQCLVAQ